MKNENNKPEHSAGVFSRSQKNSRKETYRAVESRATRKPRANSKKQGSYKKSELLPIVNEENKALSVIKTDEPKALVVSQRKDYKNRNTRTKKDYKKEDSGIFKRSSKENLKIIPIGGIEEIGKNNLI